MTANTHLWSVFSTPVRVVVAEPRLTFLTYQLPDLAVWAYALAFPFAAGLYGVDPNTVAALWAGHSSDVS